MGIKFKQMEYTKELIESFYRMMLKIRTCEESFVQPILNREILCPVHLCSGEEAVPTGISTNLRKDDYVLGTHRSHGHFLAKGGSLKELIAEIYTRETGCSRGRGGSMHLIDPENGMLGAAPIVGGTIPLATGAALASKIRKSNQVVVSYFGDGATGEGALYESLNFATLKKLPIIYACENNLYSTHMRIDEIKSTKNIVELANPFDIKSMIIDGNDVFKVYEAALDAVNHCRNGKGPVFIEFLTYRQRGHVGPDDNIQGTHTDIRPKSEIEKWLKKDPILRLEKYILDNNVFNLDELETIKKEITNEVVEATEFALNSNHPNVDELDSYVFK